MMKEIKVRGGRPMKISISNEIRRICPGIGLGVLYYTMEVKSSEGPVREEFDRTAALLAQRYQVSDIVKNPHIRETREDVYKRQAYGIEKLEIAVIGACYGNRRTGNFNLNIQRNFSVIEVGCDGYSARHLRHKAQTVQSREAGLISNYIVLCPEKPPAKQIPFVWGIVAERCV